MARKQNNNLIPNSERTPSELRAMTKKAGIASGVARREKKTLRDALSALLDAKLKGSPLTGREAVAVALFEKAMSGDVKAFQELRDTVGEKPVDKQELSGPDGSAVASEIVVRFVEPDHVD